MLPIPDDWEGMTRYDPSCYFLQDMDLLASLKREQLLLLEPATAVTTCNNAGYLHCSSLDSEQNGVKFTIILLTCNTKESCKHNSNIITIYTEII